MIAHRLTQIFIVLVAMHSIILGSAMLFWPLTTMQFFGWEYQGPLFYPAQTGIFLIILAVAYLEGLWYRPFGWFLVITKAVAVVFLLAEYYIVEVNPPRTILIAAFFDGLMGLAVGGALYKSRKNQRQIRSESR